MTRSFPVQSSLKCSHSLTQPIGGGGPVAEPVETTAGIRPVHGKWELLSRENLTDYLRAIGYDSCAICCINCMVANQISRFEYIVGVNQLVVVQIDDTGSPLPDTPTKTYDIPGSSPYPMFASSRTVETRMSTEGDCFIQELRDVSADKVIARLTSRVLADGNLHVQMCSGATVATEVYRRIG